LSVNALLTTIIAPPRATLARREYKPQTGRKLHPAEPALIAALAPALGAALDNSLVTEIQDGGMGRICFLGTGLRRTRSIVEAKYLDSDGVMVSVELNVDEQGHLFELDFWKVDFSPLTRYPNPDDLQR
jgi:hypothetical protein